MLVLLPVAAAAAPLSASTMRVDWFAARADAPLTLGDTLQCARKAR